MAFLAVALFLPPRAALAQDTIVVGRSGMPEVEVDFDAIEFPQGRPEASGSFRAFRSKGLLMPGSKAAPGERIVLTPPGSQPAAKAPRLKPPRTKQAKAGVPQLNIPDVSSAKPAMPKPPKAKPPAPAKAKKPAPAAATEMAAAPPEAPPQMDMKPEPAAKAEPKKVKVAEKAPEKAVAEPAPEPKKEPKKEPQLAAKAEKKAPPEPPAAPPPAPPAPKAKKPAIKAPEVAKPAPVAPPPAPDMAAADDGGLTPPPLPDLPDLPPPPPAASLDLPPLPKETVQEAAADLPPPPPPAEKQAKSGDTTDATEPVPMPEPVLPKLEESKQVAALPPPSTKVPTTGPLTVLFSPGSAVLNTEASERINAVHEKMESDQSLRLQLVAYATSTDDNPSRARRLSLSRALAVRSQLVEKGIKSTRMDVRALGNKFEEAPGDRVDLVLLP
ncbi:MAG: OmpA family protein [Alphaproteobacteria bacterium]|nr:OmpA family protein [Alphaproteobacteria bacterium]